MCRCGRDFQVHTTLQSYPLSSLGHRREMCVGVGRNFKEHRTVHCTLQSYLLSSLEHRRGVCRCGEILSYTQLYRVHTALHCALQSYQLSNLQNRHFIPAQVDQTSTSTWLYKHIRTTCPNDMPSTLITRIACEP